MWLLIFLNLLQSCLYLHARARSDSGMSAGLPNNSEDQRQQELTNLTNLHALQSLTNNNPSLNFYQHSPQPQVYLMFHLFLCWTRL